MNQSQITLRYAKALFDLAQERKILEKVKADMALIDQVCHENKELRGMLHNPVISVDKKQKVLHQLFEKHIDKLTLQFIDIISRKRRESYIDGIKTAYVKSAVSLTVSDKKEMVGMLNKMTGKEIELIEEIKSDLIGGFVLTMDQYQIDQSLMTKIKQLKKDFEKNLYIKGF